MNTSIIHIPQPVDPVAYVLEKVPSLNDAIDSFFFASPLSFFFQAGSAVCEAKLGNNDVKRLYEAINELAAMDHSSLDDAVAEFLEAVSENAEGLSFAKQQLRGRALELLPPLLD